MRLPNVNYGDVFLITLTNGFGILQCVQTASKTEIEIIRALPGIYSEVDLTSIEPLVGKKELFFQQLPVKYAVKQKLLTPLGNYPVPADSAAPRWFRTEHIIGSEMIGWHIVDSRTLQLRLVNRLSPKEQKFSEWGIIGIPDLAERIETGWTPMEWK